MYWYGEDVVVHGVESQVLGGPTEDDGGKGSFQAFLCDRQESPNDEQYHLGSVPLALNQTVDDDHTRSVGPSSITPW